MVGTTFLDINVYFNQHHGSKPNNYHCNLLSVSKYVMTGFCFCYIKLTLTLLTPVLLPHSQGSHTADVAWSDWKVGSSTSVTVTPGGRRESDLVTHLVNTKYALGCFVSLTIYPDLSR